MQNRHLLRLLWIATASFCGTLTGLAAVWFLLHLPMLEPLIAAPMPEWIAPQRMHPAAHPERMHLSVEEQVNANLELRLERNYGIEIELADAFGLHEQFGVDAVPYPPPSRTQHLLELSRWLQKYPPEYVRESGLRKIYLMKGWEHQGIDVGGVLLSHDAFGTMADESVFHHEMYHIMDENDGGLANENGDWLRTKYGNLPVDAQEDVDPTAAIAARMHQQARPAGFVNAYGKFGGVEEDQATVAEALLTRYDVTRRLAEGDDALRAAVGFMQEFMYARSNGRMDAPFWERIASGEPVDETYWAERERRQDFVVDERFEDARAGYHRLQRARVAADAGESEEAEDFYREVIKIDPANTQYVRELGEYYERLGRYADAIELYRRSQLWQPQSRLDLLIARDFARLGEWENAVHYYRIASEKGQLDAAGMRGFADTYRAYIEALRAGRKETQAREAEAAMREILGDW